MNYFELKVTFVLIPLFTAFEVRALSLGGPYAAHPRLDWSKKVLSGLGLGEGWA